MANLNRQLLDLFQSSDGLLLPDEIALQEISIKQGALKVWNEEIVLQGLISMRDFLQGLASQNKEILIDAMGDIDWDLNEQASSWLSKTNLNFPSVWELTRHLSNWITVFIPPVRALDIRGDWELIKCLESKDQFISTLAAIMLEDKDFNYLGSIEKFRELLNSSRQTILRLELGHLMFTRYHDSQILEKEIVPNLISSGAQYHTFLTSGVPRKRLLSYIRELVVWDIATKGEGPRKKWASWWV
ncbi:MAG: hypothetical protein ABSA01_00370 [Anaerolineales bacterium]|jgi:hypothetical protein